MPIRSSQQTQNVERQLSTVFVGFDGIFSE
jgi:hypothetical protein